jgi:DNA-binding MarR family transcriptional regulator
MPASTSQRRAAISPEVTELFFALGGVVKRLHSRPVPGADELRTTLSDRSPAPRHITALLRIGTEGPLGMSDLADRMSLSLATVSQLVSDLAEWGLVERTTDPADRRRVSVAVTPSHRATIRGLVESRLQPIERALARLEPDERAGLLRGLAALSAELDADNDNDNNDQDKESAK